MKNIRKIHFRILPLLIFGGFANAQTLDFGFEGGGKPSIATYNSWYFGAEGYETVLDSTVSKSGKFSMRTQPKYEDDDAFYQGLASHLIPEKFAAGKEIKISAWIKTEKAKGKAGIKIIGYSDTWELITRVYADTVSLNGDSDWKKVELAGNIHPDVKQVMFQLKFKGEGVVWFDDVHVSINGDSYSPTDSKKYIIEPKLNEIEWLENTVIPFEKVSTNDELEDLSFLDSMVGNASVVAMGEATHGTSEHLTVKNRMIRYLMTKLNFNAIAVEADMTAAEYVNDYVLYGKGTAEEAVKKLGYWSLRNEEVLELVEWMRIYNQTAPSKVYFKGIDIQGMDYTFENLENYFSVASESPFKSSIDESLPTIKRLYNAFQDNWYRTKSKYPELVDSCVVISKKWLNEFEDSDPWIRQNLKLINQFSEAANEGRKRRDQAMAENTLWLKEQYDKIIIWAHNAHVKKSSRYKTLGSDLAKVLGEDFISVGFTMNEGEYLAYGETGLDVFPVQPILHNSYELYFSKISAPLFALDLRLAKKDDLDSKWLTETKFGRDIGAHGFISTGYYPFILSDDFDIMIYTENTKPTTVLKK